MSLSKVKKILFFASDYKIGLSSLLTDQLIAFSRYGIDLIAIAGEKEQEQGLTEKINKEKEITINRITGLDEHTDFKRLANALKKIIKDNDIHIIHVQNNWQLALVSYIKYKLLFKYKIKIIYTLHGFRHNNAWKSHIAQIVIGTALLLFADKIICMSCYLKQKFKLLSYKIELLPLGVPDSFFTLQIPPLPGNGLQMIFPAQFRHGKNQDIIIRAFAEHIKKNNDSISKLRLPGTGELISQMKELTIKLGISDRVEFPGLLPKEEIRQLYLKSNIGIISSNSETFGQSIVEPFVLGRCIISTPVGIANDIIKEGINGYIYNTETELVQIFSNLYFHQQRIFQIGQNNLKEKDIFNWKSISQKYNNKIINTL
ncbi:glycosyltransferase family 4 protein [Bacteroides sp. ET489]|uniref:glycosyltransferase family 4 protein n=1 Tax=Bacteroides sp. ET489 TaxID=3057126 RepID=UPI00267178A5|nr:glycosyltransferase family 4 protein [Bacteroides sp. ET489]MDO3391187.1 glycosyltransferase family 4 protein [Bacteroides sp. ET489]